MKKKNIPAEFVFQLFALIIAIIIIHAFYVSVVRPTAAAVIEEQNMMAATDRDYVRVRSTWVIVKDFEQEACFILALWVLAIMFLKTKTVMQERHLLSKTLIYISPGTSILPEDALEYSRPIQNLGEQLREFLLPRTLLAGLQRFCSTTHIQAVST